VTGIELSYMVGSLGEELLPVQEFELKSHLPVRHTRIKWDNGWGDVLRMGLHQHGPDVSEIGSTWLGSLAGMEALKSFDDSAIEYLGGKDAFAPSLWSACTISDDSGMLAVPWYLDLRFILYRRDILAKAGINEKTAFQDASAFNETLKEMRAHGIEYPLLMPTANRFIHTAASWIWGAGGDFRTPDGLHMTIHEKEARQGLSDYFSLYDFIAPDARNLLERDSIHLFYDGKGAIVLGSDSHYFRIRDGSRALPLVRDNLGVALYPGIPLIGGTSLIIWRHSVQEAPALKLINDLTGSTVAKFIFEKFYLMPARVNHYDSLLRGSDPIYSLLLTALQTGRSLRSHCHWAGVETRLDIFFKQMWQDLFKDPSMDLDAEIEKRLIEVSTRLNQTILVSD
jgi:multiple sugar transport system substrate-binding protein